MINLGIKSYSEELKAVGFGENIYAQQGDGSVSRRTTIPFADGTCTWKKIAFEGLTSHKHIMGIRGDDTLWAQGDNEYYQLGDGTTITRDKPVQIGTSTWKDVACGSNYAMAIRADNTLWGWGQNLLGVFGDGSTTNKTIPTQIGTSTWKSLCCSGLSTQAILYNDTLWVCGNNYYGQLANATTNNTSNPTFLQVGTSAWKSVVSKGNTVYAISNNNNILWAWGSNSYGQIGDGQTITQRLTPVQVGFSAWKKISAGNYHTLGIMLDGTLWGWGGSAYGQLGIGAITTFRYYSPVSIGTTLGLWKSIEGGWGNSLAIRSDDTLWSWGMNGSGELGDGSTVTARTTPIQIGTSTWKKIICDNNFGVCSIDYNDNLYSWGDIYSWGTQIIYNTPQLQKTPIRWKRVWNTGMTGFGIKDDDTLWSWGNNGWGQLGDFTTVSKSVPTQVGVFPSMKSVAGGEYHTLALNYNDILYSWGRNDYGQLGNGTTAVLSFTPVLLTGTFATMTWKSIIGGGYHTLALNYNDILYSWGFNYYGQLGNGTTATYNSTPSLLVAPFNTSTWRFVASGYDCVFAINYSNILYVWGNNAYGRLGDSSTATYSPIPITISTTSTMTRIMKSKSAFGVDNTTGTAHIDGTLFAWGNNNFDFTNTSTWIPSPIQVNKSTWKVTWKTLSNCAGGGSTGPSQLAIDTDGKMWAWGVNDLCQLGTGSNYVATTFILSPMLINASVTWKAVANGNPFSLALDSNGYLYATGFNGYGQFGNGVTASFYVHTKIGTSTWNSIYASMYYSSGILSDNTLWAWGYNNKGQLGDGSITDKKSPTQVLISQSTWKMVDIGEAHALAIAGDNTLWAWGRNYSGQLGDGTTVDKTTPVMIGSSTWKIVSAATGGNADMGWSLAIRGDNTLWAWGNNFYGSLGDGGTTNRPAPVQIGASTWTAVSAGGAHALAILGSNNTLWAWGNNSQGQVGDGGTTNRPAPVQVGTSTWIVISAGGLGAFGDAHPQTGIGIPCCKTMLQLKNGGSVTCAFANELTNSRTIRMERILKEILIVYLV